MGTASDYRSGRDLTGAYPAYWFAFVAVLTMVVLGVLS